MSETLEHTSTETTAEHVPTIDELLALSPQEAALILQGIPDRSIFKIGINVANEASSYEIFGGLAARVAGLFGNLKAAQGVANDNASRASNLRRLEELFLAEYDRRSAMRRQASDRESAL